LQLASEQQNDEIQTQTRVDADRKKTTRTTNTHTHTHTHTRTHTHRTFETEFKHMRPQQHRDKREKNNRHDKYQDIKFNACHTLQKKPTAICGTL